MNLPIDTRGHLVESSGTAVHEIADLARQATAPAPLEPGHIYVVHKGDGDTETINLTGPEYGDPPVSKAGTFTVSSADSFNAYLDKHGTARTEIWADPNTSTIVGVIDAHAAASDKTTGEAGWMRHRVMFAPTTTVGWNMWSANDGNLLDQVTIAELIEDRQADILEPSGAEMLELVQSFQANVDVRFESARSLSTGERVLTFKEDVTASAGKTGQLTIPESFVLALKPFEGAATFRVTARFRYRLRDGKLSIGYRLERPEDVVREAFDTVVATIRDHAEHASCLFMGRSAN